MVSLSFSSGKNGRKIGCSGGRRLELSPELNSGSRFLNKLREDLDMALSVYDVTMYSETGALIPRT